MTKSQSDYQVGDTKSTPLRTEEFGMAGWLELAERVNAETAQKACRPSVIQSQVYLTQSSKRQDRSVTTCRQTLWLSFFFDGTGNNRYVDEDMLKHSNVAKLFTVHQSNDKARGIYAFYMQGVGTYFPEKNDDGGGSTELGCGAKGTARLDYALDRFDETVKYHSALAVSAESAIVEINISVFGFSRGSALARAFINLLLDERTDLRGGKRILKNSRWPLRIRFMGLFDTVASVGLPLSTTTTNSAAAIFSSLRMLMTARLLTYPKSRPDYLALSFHGSPGADPAPGWLDGHSGWGSRLDIDPAVEEVRHFVAAHEVRNSFPLDSVSAFRSGHISKPGYFYETVYPGVHSDVGGSYAPGEGGRSAVPGNKLGVIPLMHMYNCALRSGVPLLPVSAWSKKNQRDFYIHPDLAATYDHYMKRIGSSTNVGELMNRHMSLYYAWRFRAIRLRQHEGNAEIESIESWKKRFYEQKIKLEKEIEELSRKEESAQHEFRMKAELRNAISTSFFDEKSASKMPSSDDVALARAKAKVARNDLMMAKARLNALPNMEELQKRLELYDSQLLDDVKAIRIAMLGAKTSDRNVLGFALRPHYKALLEAYENEFEKEGRGLSDEKVIKFFDDYVHDSLAGFAKDATLPSDPRVVYLGGDTKYAYASLNDASNGEGSSKVA